MSLRKKIKELIIVEGKTDIAKIKSLFDADVIATNGLAITEKKINDIQKLSKNKGIIIFMDPDGPGEKIRKILIDKFAFSKNCFLTKEDMVKGNKKIGIAEAKNEAIILALQNIVTFIKENNSISWNEFINLEIDSKIKRQKICSFLKISYCNNKQLFKRINMMNLTFFDLKKIINE